MSSYKIALCDDDKLELDYLTDLVRKWGHRKNVSITLEAFQNSSSFLFALSDLELDIVLLDIEMPEISGLELAEKIKARNDHTQIIFVSGYSEYISFGYDVEALHYLLKPVDELKLFEVLDKAIAKLGQKRTNFVFKDGSEMIILALDEIRYISVSGNYTTIYATKEYLIKSPLSLIEHKLDDSFVKVSRSEIVALRQITKLTHTLLYLKDGTIIGLPRGAYEKINRAIIERI